MIYKVSYVVLGKSHPGAILDEEERPQAGDLVRFGGAEFRILEVVDLIPEYGEFAFVHATCEHAVDQLNE